MTIRSRISAWLSRRKVEKAARRILAAALRDPDVLRGTSLRPRHGARWVILDLEEREGTVSRIWFGILRHPRPYAFSPQSHKVIERYLYDVEARRITRMGGHNVTRSSGRDADD
jgi:hypothetical protein